MSWREPQTFEPGTSHQVRHELQDLVARDLLGPWGGETEQFAPRSAGPRDRYLVGMLGPRHSAAEAEALPDLHLDVQDFEDAELPDRLSAQSLGQMRASSMGCCSRSRPMSISSWRSWCGAVTRRRNRPMKMGGRRECGPASRTASNGRSALTPSGRRGVGS